MREAAERAAAKLRRKAAATLATAGIAQAAQEAAWLWGGLLVPRSLGEPWLGDDPEPPPEPADHPARFRAAVERRAGGEPLAYVLGWHSFRMLDLTVDPRVLIPRPETEGLVQLVLDWARARGRWGRAADIGTGSGCVAMSLALEGHFDVVVATDVSEDALAVARANVKAHGMGRQVTFRRGDLLHAVRDDLFDVIVCNPPYLTPAEFEATDRSVRCYEPLGALVGGADGLGVTRALLAQAASRLLIGGLLAVEVDCGRAEVTRDLALAAGWSAVRLECDVFGRRRFLLASRE